MQTKQTSTICNFDFELFKSFSKFENDTLILNESISPDFISIVDNIIENQFKVLYTKENTKCPKCDSPLMKNGTDTHLLNKIRRIKLQKYKCINKNCNKYVKTSLREFIDKSCNYTKNIRESGLNMDLISQISYDKKSEIINHFKGFKIPRSTVYNHENVLSPKFLKKQETQINKLLKKAKIEPSGYYHYDEQYVFIDTKLYYRMTLLDAKNNLVINEKLINHKEFEKNTIQNFLEKSLNHLPLEAIITDGNTAYPSIIEALGAIHQKCIFHKIQNLMFKVLKKRNKYKRRISKYTKKLEHHIQKIKQLKNKNKGQKWKIKLKDKKRRKTQNKIKKIEKETRQIRTKIRENKEKIKELEKYVNKITLMFKSKKEKTVKKRLQKLINQIKEIPPVIAEFVKKLPNTIEHFTRHFYNNEIPNTNNKIELYYKTTMPRSMKKTFRTTKGFLRRIKLQKLRWTKRNVLNIK